VAVSGNKHVSCYLLIHGVLVPENISKPHPAFADSAIVGVFMLLGINLDVWMDMQMNFFLAH
jgi:hypothetical protein